MVLKVDGTEISTYFTGLVTDNSQSVFYNQVKNNGTEVWQTQPGVVPSITYPSSAEVGSTITINWEDAFRASGYKAEYSKNNGVNWHSFYTGTALSSTKTLDSVGTWKFRVRAYNYSGTTLQYSFDDAWRAGSVCSVVHTTLTVTVTEEHVNFIVDSLLDVKSSWGFNLGYPPNPSNTTGAMGSINIGSAYEKTINAIQVTYHVTHEGWTGGLFGGGGLEFYGTEITWTFEFCLQGTLSKNYILSVTPQGASKFYTSASTHINIDGNTYWKWEIPAGDINNGKYGWDGTGTRTVVIERS